VRSVKIMTLLVSRKYLQKSVIILSRAWYKFNVGAGNIQTEYFFIRKASGVKLK